ncbi:MAG: hypothetical protein JXB06_11485 [Spirochaetales bacterium]|nr:hypothetical protein [Spirochaetales bacterium]
MKKVAPLLLAVLVAAAVFPQEAGKQSAVAFVSKLKAKAVDSRIHVSWRNPANLQGSILLYRHTEEIDQSNLDEAELLATLEADQESYEDAPEDAGWYYYAALIREDTGTIQRFLVPFRNKTSEAARITVRPSAQSPAAEITGIRALIAGDSVQVTFKVSNPGRDLLLFRGNDPIRATEDLVEAYAPLQLDAGTTSFLDLPIPGVETYYAVIDSESFKLGKQTLVPGENTTEQAVVLPLGSGRSALPPLPAEEAAAPGQPSPAPGAVRQTAQAPPAAAEAAAPGKTAAPETSQPAAGAAVPAPAAAAAPAAATAGISSGSKDFPTTQLPYLQPPQGTPAGVPRRAEQLDPRTLQAISRLLTSAPPVQAARQSLVILPEDRNGPASGESASLQKILREHLLAGNYGEAESKLQGFLNIRRSPDTEARVRFYLAQAYYFQGLYEEALLEFVLCQERLYGPVQPWLESCFRRLWNQP